MNPDLSKLQPYPFEKLNALKATVSAPADKSHIALSIGEPKHQPPAFALKALTDNLARFANYPSTKGLPELRTAIANWANTRFNLQRATLDAEANVLPVNGTREALFAFAQACIDSSKADAKVLMPNPFYQIYEGAAFLAGAEPVFLNCLPENGFIPDFDAISEQTWQACQLLFICTPGNPTGAVMSRELLEKLIGLADKYNFIIASDECYSELYFDEANPPTGLLEACESLGKTDFKNCVVFHSLSKRSNLPGLRSGFVAGDAHIIDQFFQYRTYHGCAMSVPCQLASIAAWQDEAHVLENRNLYRQKFDAVIEILKDVLPVSAPDASFYLWPKTPIADTDFAQQLFAQQNVTVLPGRFLARDCDGVNPGENYVRLALVAELEECIEAAHRIKAFVQSLNQTLYTNS